MPSASQERDCKRLEQELKRGEYRRLLWRLERRNVHFKSLGAWEDVIQTMHEGSIRDPHKDSILRPILRAQSDDGDTRWQTILLAIFWPSLRSIHFQKRGWDQDQDERWQSILWAFLRAVCRIDVNRRPHRLAQKILNDTVHVLYEDYRRAWARGYRETATKPSRLAGLAGGGEEPGFTAAEFRDAQEVAITGVWKHVESGRLKRRDFALIVGTRIYGESVADYARRNGLSYETIKKRRQRAEAVVRRFEIFGDFCPRV